MPASGGSWLKPMQNAPAQAACEYRYPDFLCIGAQKAGTTWLDRNLRRHPDVFLPPMKELQFFSHLHLANAQRWTNRQRRTRGTQLLNRYLSRCLPAERDYRRIGRLADIVAGPITDAWYGRMFALAGPDQVCGEFTPDYYILPDAGIAHVLRLSPEVRIVLSLRDPIERSWSHLRMLARTRGLATESELAEFAVKDDLFARADYCGVMERWQAYVPKERFLVVFMEEIVETPNALLEKVCAFLGVAYGAQMFPNSGDSVHAGEAQEMPPAILALLKDRFRPIYDGIAARYPEMGLRWAARYY